MSTRIDTTNANANAAPRVAAKVVVWVMKPGPMALVAIRNIAPSSIRRRSLAVVPGRSPTGCSLVRPSLMLPPSRAPALGAAGARAGPAGLRGTVPIVEQS